MKRHLSHWVIYSDSDTLINTAVCWWFIGALKPSCLLMLS